MKSTLVLLLTVLLACMVTACSLPFSDTATGTQADGTSLGSNIQESSEDINQADLGEAPANSEELVVEESTNVKLVKAVLFFATPDNSALKQEEREIQVVDGAILKACMLALIDGPQTQGLAGTIPEGTTVRGISVKNGVATVDLSNEFGVAEGDAGIVARLSIVNTLTKINGISKVRFHVDGEDMIGPGGSILGDISPVLLNADGTPAAGN